MVHLDTRCSSLPAIEPRADPARPGAGSRLPHRARYAGSVSAGESDDPGAGPYRSHRSMAMDTQGGLHQCPGAMATVSVPGHSAIRHLCTGRLAVTGAPVRTLPLADDTFDSAGLAPAAGRTGRADAADPGDTGAHALEPGRPLAPHVLLAAVAAGPDTTASLAAFSGTAARPLAHRHRRPRPVAGRPVGGRGKRLASHPRQPQAWALAFDTSGRDDPGTLAVPGDSGRWRTAISRTARRPCHGGTPG